MPNIQSSHRAHKCSKFHPSDYFVFYLDSRTWPFEQSIHVLVLYNKDDQESSGKDKAKFHFLDLEKYWIQDTRINRNLPFRALRRLEHMPFWCRVMILVPRKEMHIPHDIGKTENDRTIFDFSTTRNCCSSRHDETIIT